MNRIEYTRDVHSLARRMRIHRKILEEYFTKAIASESREELESAVTWLSESYAILERIANEIAVDAGGEVLVTRLQREDETKEPCGERMRRERAHKDAS